VHSVAWMVEHSVVSKAGKSADWMAVLLAAPTVATKAAQTAARSAGATAEERAGR
jgi:hypothetical protein